MKNLICSVVKYTHCTVLRLSGELDAYTAEVLESEIQNQLNRYQYNIVINLEHLQYISSAGLGVFMGFVDAVREKTGDLKFCCLSDNIFNVFDILGFPTVFEFYKSESDAVGKFSE